MSKKQQKKQKITTKEAKQRYELKKYEKEYRKAWTVHEQALKKRGATTDTFFRSTAELLVASFHYEKTREFLDRSICNLEVAIINAIKTPAVTKTELDTLKLGIKTALESHGVAVSMAWSIGADSWAYDEDSEEYTPGHGKWDTDIYMLWKESRRSVCQEARQVAIETRQVAVDLEKIVRYMECEVSLNKKKRTFVIDDMYIENLYGATRLEEILRGDEYWIADGALDDNGIAEIRLVRNDKYRDFSSRKACHNFDGPPFVHRFRRI